MKKLISILLILCIVVSAFAFSVSAGAPVPEIRINSISNFAVVSFVSDLQYDISSSACEVLSLNIQSYDGSSWSTVQDPGEATFQYNVRYRLELWFRPFTGETNYYFESSELPNVICPSNYTFLPQEITDDGLWHCYLELGVPKVVPPSMFFSDVHESDWFYSDIGFVYYNLIMKGVGNDRFDPNGTCTRAMVVTVLYRMIGEPGMGGTCPFTDVKEDAWYYCAVKWAQNCGVVNGMTPTTFEPDTPVSREQLATILYRFTAQVLPSADLNGVMLIGFTDHEDISDWAGDALSWAFGHGIIGGTDTETGKFLYPQDNATRCQVATILHRYCENYPVLP